MAAGWRFWVFPLSPRHDVPRIYAARRRRNTHWPPMLSGCSAMIMPRILASGFYAQKNVKTPTKIAIIIFAFLHTDIQPAAGVASATRGAVAGYCTGRVGKRTAAVYHAAPARTLHAQSRLARLSLRVLAATAAMAAVLWLAQSLLAADWTAMRGMRRAMLLLGWQALGRRPISPRCGQWVRRVREFRRKEG